MNSNGSSRRSGRNIRDVRHGDRIAHEDPCCYTPPYTCKCENCHFQSEITSVQRNEAQDKIYEALKKVDHSLERQKGLKLAFDKEKQYLSSSKSMEQYERRINRCVARLEAKVERAEDGKDEPSFMEWIMEFLGLQ